MQSKKRNRDMGRKGQRDENPAPNSSPPIKPTILLKRIYMKALPNQKPNNQSNEPNEPNEPSTSKINNQYGNQNRNNYDSKNVSLMKRVTVRIILCIFMCTSSVVHYRLQTTMRQLVFNVEIFAKIFTIDVFFLRGISLSSFMSFIIFA